MSPMNPEPLLLVITNADEQKKFNKGFRNIIEKRMRNRYSNEEPEYTKSLINLIVSFPTITAKNLINSYIKNVAIIYEMSFFHKQFTIPSKIFSDAKEIQEGINKAVKEIKGKDSLESKNLEYFMEKYFECGVIEHNNYDQLNHNVNVKTSKMKA